MNPFWECEQGTEAIQKIRGMGHLVFPCPRGGESAEHDCIAVSLDGGKKWKHPSAFCSDVYLWNLDDLRSFIELGPAAFLFSQQERVYKSLARHHRIFWRDGTDEVVSPEETGCLFVPSQRRLLARLAEDGVRAYQVEVFNPFTNTVTERLKPIYGFAFRCDPDVVGSYVVNENSRKKIVVLRPAEENPPKLPSTWAGAM